MTPMRRLTDQQRGSVIPDSLRPVLAPLVAWLGAAVVGWLAEKGVDLSTAQLAGLMGTLGGVGSKLLAAVWNPNDVAAPSMVKQSPVAPYAGAPLRPEIPELELPPPPRPPEARLGSWTVSPVVDGPAITTNEPFEGAAETVQTETPAPKPAAKKRAPRKKKPPTDVVKLRRETDVPLPASGDTARGFADYVPTAGDLPRNISPRPKLTSDDSGIV